MRDDNVKRQVERWFDGESPNETLEVPADAKAEADAYLKEMETIRDGLREAAPRPVIGDGQFPAFMSGIREGIEAGPRPARRSAWAVLSLAASALIVAVSILFILDGGGNGPHDVVSAAPTEVETASSEIDGVRIDIDNETGTVWVSDPGGDLW